jgi:peptidyl-tRNA hydrolase, PTH1 family
MKLIVGLGNPGTAYKGTRHNLGFMVVAALAEQYKADFRKCSVSDAKAAKVSIESEVCVLSLPQTYMNNSGVVVKAQAAKMGIALEDILIVYDDLAIPFGQMRIRPNGSAGGHNGIKSTIQHLGNSDFARLRLGISRPKPGVDPADYVLSNFTPAEKKLLPDFINDALLCVHSWVTEGVETAMNKFNKRKTTHE